MFFSAEDASFDRLRTFGRNAENETTKYTKHTKIYHAKD